MAKKKFILMVLAPCCLISWNLVSRTENIRIGYWSSWKTSCGIALFTEQLVNALQKIGYTVFAYKHTTPLHTLIAQIKKDKINILNLEHESTLFHRVGCVGHNFNVFSEFIDSLRKLGIKIIVTVHTEDNNIKKLYDHVDHFIYMKPSNLFKKSKKITYIPLPAPIFNPPTDRLKLREKYGFDEKTILISTQGFLIGWKQFPDVLDRLAPFVKSHERYHIQILASYNSNNLRDGRDQDKKVREVIAKHKIESQTTFITRFLPQNELNERLWISDVGYLWGDFNSKSTSAAGRAFITARLPLVTTECSHYHDIDKGAIKTLMKKTIFVETIINVAHDGALLECLRKSLEDLYQRLNYDTVIHEHVRLFKRVLKRTPENPVISLYKIP